MDCHLKMYNRWLRLLTMLLPGMDLHCAEPLDIWRFLHFSVKYRGRPYKVLPSKRGALRTLPYYGESGPSYCIMSIKTLDEGRAYERGGRGQWTSGGPSRSP